MNLEEAAKILMEKLKKNNINLKDYDIHKIINNAIEKGISS